MKQLDILPRMKEAGTVAQLVAGVGLRPADLLACVAIVARRAEAAQL